VGHYAGGGELVAGDNYLAEAVGAGMPYPLTHDAAHDDDDDGR